MTMFGEEAKQTLQEGTAALQVENPAEAIRELARAFDLDPSLIDVGLTLAILQLQEGDLDESWATIQKVLQQAPEHPLGLAVSGAILLEQGQLDEALSRLEKAYSSLPNDSLTHGMMVKAYLMTGRFEDARVAAERLVKLNPDSADAHALLGHAYYSLGDRKRATSALKQAVRLDPDLGVPHFLLGVMEVEGRRWRKAIPHLEKTLEIDPEHAGALASLGLALAETGQMDAALDALEEALVLETDDPDVLRYAGEAYLALDCYDEALNVYRSLSEIEPGDPIPHYLVGRLSAITGNQRQMRKAYAMLMRLDPELAHRLARETGLNEEPRAAQPATGEKATSPTESKVYQIKVTLKGTRPPIWRRLLVTSDTRLSELHDILQIAMGWDDDHLHVFRVGHQEYADPSHELEGAADESRVTLGQIAPDVKSKLVYEYDFGDSWVHEIVVEKILEPEAGVKYPLCVTGKRSGPPEDIGGVGSYAHLLEAIQDPDHPEHEQYLEWVGEDFDPEAFDCDDVNEELQRMIG
ncbi:MAG: tetratricopeptide repeat protein [Armatimonadetes bacterium]|jgi:tetratricopeptide (TPR) repeat protein|nr:tetratricopeptide repeat protein [Armatimonadota bacterium]